MDNIYSKEGETPFEKVQADRSKSQLLLVTHLAVKELVKQLDECEAAIDLWQETISQYNSGKVDKNALEAQLMLATQALKDKKLFEEALIKICTSAGTDLGLEA